MDRTERRLSAVADDAQAEVNEVAAKLRVERDPAERRQLQSQMQRAVKRRVAAAGALRKYRDDKARRN